MDGLAIIIDKRLRAQEVAELRQACGLEADPGEWEKVLPACMARVSARTDDGRLVGVGFLVGNVRHAELTDLAVLPEFRRHHVGRQIVERLLAYAREEHVRYLTLYSDPSSPWLKDFYATLGFRSVDFGMWHEASIPPTLKGSQHVR